MGTLLEIVLFFFCLLLSFPPSSGFSLWVLFSSLRDGLVSEAKAEQPIKTLGCDLEDDSVQLGNVRLNYQFKDAEVSGQELLEEPCEVWGALDRMGGILCNLGKSVYIFQDCLLILEKEIHLTGL